MSASRPARGGTAAGFPEATSERGADASKGRPWTASSSVARDIPEGHRGEGPRPGLALHRRRAAGMSRGTPRRAVLPGAGHFDAAAPGFTERLEQFFVSAG